MPSEAPGVSSPAISSRWRLAFPRNVWLLGLCSLFTDTASEAIYPLLPIYLTTVLGAGALSLGLIEGAAEAVNSVLKVLAGHVSDRWRVRKPIIIAGYGISSAVRPLIALASGWGHVLAVRLADRVGKGIRGAPRDALLAAAATPTTRGRIYGFHRAMDHTGAVIGPLLASLFLFLAPGQYRLLFAMTLIPGALAVWMLTLVREDTPRAVPAQGAASPGLGVGARALPRDFNLLLLVLLVFTLGNSADAFLLLRLSDLGVPVALVPLLWALLHVIKATFSIWGGIKSDAWGRRGMIAAGWLIYAVVYAGFAVTSSATAVVAWFLVYGLYYGLSEGTEKALIADLAPPQLRGTAFGLYNAALGIGSLCASLLFGLVWKLVSPAAAFALGATLAVLATVLLFTLVPEPGQERHV